ncbi:MAG TPA: dihydrolipoamide acetyltransferase family protein [bacterium]|nr:dihydrolipoamide acetyltransferase family protein [bacterium]
MATPVILPKFSMTMEEGTILRWLKDVGAAVAQGEPIAEVMTEKVNMEIEAPASGRLGGIRAVPGDTVAATSVIAYILGEGESPPEMPVAAPPRPAAAEPAVPPRAAAAGPSETPAGGRPAAATPVARGLARDAGIDLSTIVGTGPAGRVTEADVRAALAARARPSGVGLSARRRTIAQRMLRSAREIPHVYLTRTVDMSAAAAARGAASYTAVIVWAAARALGGHPRMRASLDGETVAFHDAIDIGIAVDTPDGLIVPVIRDASHKDPAEIHREIETLATRARAGELGITEIRDAVFTVSNLGMLGVDAFTALINPPQSAILAVGAVRQRPWVVDGVVAVRPLCDLTVAVDHRIADGADGARFLDNLCNRLEHPSSE